MHQRCTLIKISVLFLLSFLYGFEENKQNQMRMLLCMVQSWRGRISETFVRTAREIALKSQTGA